MVNWLQISIYMKATLYPYNETFNYSISEDFNP